MYEKQSKQSSATKSTASRKHKQVRSSREAKHSWNCPVAGCGSKLSSRGAFAHHMRQSHVFLPPAETKAIVSTLEGLDICNHVFTTRGLERHNCHRSSRLHELKFSWAYCPFLRLVLIYTDGDSFGDEAGIPTELRSVALRAAHVVSDHVRIRDAIFEAFRQGNHAYINGAKQARLAKMIEDSGEEGKRTMTAFTTYAANAHPTVKRQLDSLLKRQRKGSLRMNSADAVDAKRHEVPSSSAPVTFATAANIPSPLNIAQHGRIHKFVPKASRKLFTQICREALRRYADASAVGDEDSMLLHLVTLLQIPARTLTIIPRGSVKPKRGRNALNERLRRVLHDIRIDATPLPGSLTTIRVDVPNPNPTQARINHALQLKAKGYTSRARKALEWDG